MPTRCPTCGSSSDLLERVVRVGLTHEVVTECADKIGCWVRWDLAHGLATPQSEPPRLAINQNAAA